MNDIALKDNSLPISKRTCVMGVLNVTPDSFSDGGESFSVEAAVRKAGKMQSDGADIIDIGGESSRPCADPVSEGEEIKRVIPVIRALKDELDIPLSIDTYKSGVARAAIEEGVEVVNDISGLNADKAMAGVIAESGVACVLMHMKGTPKTMQDEPEYGDVVKEVSVSLKESVRTAEDAGVDPGKIVIDPGIGFGKTLEDNLVILKELRSFLGLGKPILVGTSRKSFIGAITSRDVKDRIFGTAASVCVAVLNGASIVRVHDVREISDVVKITDAIKGA